MKNNEANILVFIASIIIGILISMNISFSRQTNRIVLNAKQYQDAYNYKNGLYSEITGLINQYNDYASKVKKYKNDSENREKITTSMKEELNENNIVLGRVPLQGQGVLITLDDGNTKDASNQFEYQLRIIHNTDIIQVINDLKNAGAEAISLNGQRIIDRSEVYCSGPFLRINGIKIAAPFVIYAIGNKDVMYNYMISNENYLKSLTVRNINVDVKQINNVKVPAYNGEEKIGFMKNED
ncbi:DUF881 domain-containing protein [Clostridium fermenticellae]|uniref:DUF881 domain-containing protein n=1 Tax=Clostridium fermenticellae TaxID=2068654 RepID=A0A386H4I1_9CLOT|nr:DUF881 domain-containing protein [Clostridium fermenticellae]AYD40629.1 DUF881 domain-containing protein [Clostridium fermenticellae]